MSIRFTKKSLLSAPGRSVNTPWDAPPALASRARIPPTSTDISEMVRFRSDAFSTSSSAWSPRVPAPEVVPETVRPGLEQVESVHVGLRSGGVGAARLEGDPHPHAATLGGEFDAGGAAQNDEVGERNPLVTRLGPIEVALDPFENPDHSGQLLRIVGGPVLLGGQSDPGAVGAAPHVRGAEGGGRGPGGAHEFRTRKTGAQNIGLQDLGVLRVDQGVVPPRAPGPAR